MNITFCKRLTLSWLMLLSALCIQASENIERFLAAGGLDRSSTAVMIVDLADGRVLESLNPDKPLLPASTMKAVTTASLINVAGPSYRYHTKIYLDGKRGKGTEWTGNLIIEGSGDPSLHSSKAPGSTYITEEVAEALRNEGIEHIQGKIIIDETLFETRGGTPDCWEPEDLRSWYGTGTYALNFENNLSGKTPVSNPAAVLENRLRNSLADKGITVHGEELRHSGRRLLFDHVSEPLEEIMRSCMMRSDNMYAEALLRTYSLETGGSARYEDAVKKEKDKWKKTGAPMYGVEIFDGSGLSRKNRLTADFLSYVLEEMKDDVEYASFFPLAGQEGTLKSFLKDTHLDSYVALKTGTLKDVKAYAGYKLDDDFAPTHAIVIFMNKTKGNSKASAAAAQLLKDVFQ